MDDVDRLAQIAAQLAGRVREFDATSNGVWLAAMLPDPADWFRLAFVLAAAVPDDRTWLDLTAWTTGPAKLPAPAALQPCGTNAAAQRHRAHGEPLDDPCAEAERATNRVLKRAQRARAKQNPEQMEIAA